MDVQVHWTLLQSNKYTTTEIYMKSNEFIKNLKEDAGATGSSSVAVTVQTLGEKGSFSKQDVGKRLTGYTNQLSAGGIVKGVKSSKVK